MPFEVNKPVLLQATMTNPNEAEIRQHTIIRGIKAEDGSDEQLVSFQGNIASSGNTTLELYWIPDIQGNYSIVLFPKSLSSTEQTNPIAEIPFIVE